VKRATVLLLGAAIQPARAQYEILSEASEKLLSSGAVIPIQKNITDLKGFPVPQKTKPGEALPPSNEDDKRLYIIQSGPFTVHNHEWVIKDGMEAIYRGYRIHAKSGYGSFTTEIFTFQGDVQILGRDGTVRGEKVTADFKHRTFRTENGLTDLRPDLFKGNLLSDLYIRSDEAEGTVQNIIAKMARATTCTYDDPHFELVAKRARIRPNKRAVFHDVDLIVTHHKLLRLPYLALPLNEPNTDYVPQMGHNQLEGYFVRGRYGVPLANDVDSLTARVDYFTKLGNGLGGDFRYGKNLQDRLSLYGITGGPRSIEAASEHRQNWKRLGVFLANTYQNHDYLLDPNAILLNTRADVSFAGKKDLTKLSFDRNSSTTTGFTSTSENVNLSDNRSWTKALTSNFQLNWSSYETAAGATNISTRQAVLNSDIKDDFAKAVAELQYQRTIPIGDTNNFFNASDITPVFSLSSDSARLFGQRFQREVPFTAQLSTGQFADPSNKGNVQRTAFDFNVNKNGSTAQRSTFNWNGRFRQGLYSDNTAQFIVGLNTQFAYKLGKDTALNLQYNLLRPEGFSPLGIDQAGHTNLGTTSLTIRPLRPVLLGAQTGYDFTQLHNSQTPWQSLGVRAEYQPYKSFSVRSLSTYDTFQRGWTNIRGDIGLQRGRAFYALGLRYDAVRETMGNVNFYGTGIHYGRIGSEIRLEYNGYLRGFDAEQYAFTYDLHDAEVVFQMTNTGFGVNSGRQIQLFLRLKALPFNSLFGSGQRGQAIGTGTGRDF
jgi:hypothetical protein